MMKFFSKKKSGLFGSLILFLTFAPMAYAATPTAQSLFAAFSNYVSPNISASNTKTVKTSTPAPVTKPVVSMLVTKPANDPPMVVTNQAVITNDMLTAALRNLLASNNLPSDILAKIRAQVAPGGVLAAGPAMPTNSVMYMPVGVVEPAPVANLSAGLTYSSVTNFSSNLLTANTANVSTLNVTGTTDLKDLNVSGTVTGNFAGTVNPSLTLGSVPFQGASGLTEDNSNFFWDASDKRLGIGTSAPATSLDVEEIGQNNITSNVIPVGNFAGGISGPVNIYSSDNQTTDDTSGRFTVGAAIESEIHGSGNIPGGINGASIIGSYNGSGTVGTGPLTGVYGSDTEAHLNSGTSYDLTVGYFAADIGGTATNIYGVQVISPTVSGGGTATNNYGVYADNQNAGTNNYGFYTNQTTSGSNDYSLYNAGTAQSYFAGSVGIGINEPTSILEVSGTPSAGTPVAQISNTTGTAGQANNALFILGGNNAGTGASQLITFKRTDGTIIGSVSQPSASAVAFNTSSDKRIKENITPTTYGLSDLMKINVDDFNYISDPSQTKETGFLAQELDAIYPEAVTTNGDNGTDPLAPNATPWMVDYSKLTPLLVKSVQDLNLKISGMTSTGGTSLAGSIGDFADSVLTNVENGAAYLKGVVTNTLTVGSSTAPAGITIYDKVTNAPYCVSMQNGTLTSSAGTCDSQTTSSGSVVNNTGSENSANTTASTTTTTTANSSADSTAATPSASTTDASSTSNTTSTTTSTSNPTDSVDSTSTISDSTATPEATTTAPDSTSSSATPDDSGATSGN